MPSSRAAERDVPSTDYLVISSMDEAPDTVNGDLPQRGTRVNLRLLRSTPEGPRARQPAVEERQPPFNVADAAHYYSSYSTTVQEKYAFL